MKDRGACVVTREQTKLELEAIELRLGDELCIETGIRMELLSRERKGTLEHTDSVAQWQQTYASYLDWMAEDWLGYDYWPAVRVVLADGLCQRCRDDAAEVVS
jgi:hypothetical protein